MSEQPPHSDEAEVSRLANAYRKRTGAGEGLTDEDAAVRELREQKKANDRPSTELGTGRIYPRWRDPDDQTGD